MFFLWLSMGAVYVYAIKFVIMGNPSYALVQRAPPVLLQQVVVCLEQERIPDDERVYRFMQLFFRLSLLTVLLLVIEFSVIFYFLVTYPSNWLAWGLFGKNVGLLIVGFRQHQASEEENVIDTIRMMPVWIIRWERIGYLITAVGFIGLFYLANQTPA